MSKYQLVLRCKACRYKYKRTVELFGDESIDDVPNPSCPKCAKRAMRTDSYETASPPLSHDGMNGIIESGRAPGIVGDKAIVRAIDKTAEIVMADHKLTDLRTDVREGDTMAPRLPPPQQKLADNFFGPVTKTPTMANKRQQAKMQSMLRRAVGGAYRASAIDVKSVLPDQRVAMRRVGTEQINR